jgi:hypothetical protein
MAALCKEGDPESAFMDVTWPDVSTRASKVTVFALPVAKSGSAFGEAIARTDLINFGGTIPASSEGGTTETSAALLSDGGAVRFTAESAASGFSCPAAASAAESAANLASTAVSGRAGVEGLAVPNAVDCEASCVAALEVAGASLVCGDLAESACALAVF